MIDQPPVSSLLLLSGLPGQCSPIDGCGTDAWHLSTCCTAGVREQGPGGELSAGARVGMCVIGYAQEEDAETRAHRQRIREGYAKMLTQYNRTRAP